MAIEELPIDLADAVRVSNLVAVLVQEQDDQARFPRVALARRVQALEQEPVVREAAREWRLDLRVELEHGPVAERELPLDLQAGRELLGPVAVRLVRDQPLDQPAAAGPIVSVATVHRGAEEAARSAAVAEITLAPVAAEAVPAWVAVVLVAAEEAVVAAAVVAAAAEAVAAVAEEDAGDEQFSNEINTYEIEIKHHELIKNFVACVYNRHVSCGGAFIASCVGN
jgi:hypothetical protein